MSNERTALDVMSQPLQTDSGPPSLKWLKLTGAEKHSDIASILETLATMQNTNTKETVLMSLDDTLVEYLMSIEPNSDKLVKKITDQALMTRGTITSIPVNREAREEYLALNAQSQLTGAGSVKFCDPPEPLRRQCLPQQF